MQAPTDSSRWDHVAGNIARVRSEIAQAAARAGRSSEAVTLVAVSKGVPLEGVQAAMAAGQRVFGENRVQEWLPKQEAMRGSGAVFHLIGHLQRNKAKAAVAFDMIESVDSVRIATALHRHLDRRMPVLLEVNASGETSKGGVAPADIPAAVAAIRMLPQLRVEGLMTVAPMTPDAETLRSLFQRMEALRREHGLESLSMGMTNDFPVAVEEGATLVRIGRAIFGTQEAAGPGRAGR